MHAGSGHICTSPQLFSTSAQRITPGTARHDAVVPSGAPARTLLRALSRPGAAIITDAAT